MRTQKPTLRITKSLRKIQSPGPARAIPFEAECAACADAQFKIKYDKRRECGRGTISGPPADGSMEVLQRQFEEHLKLVHPDEYTAIVKERRERDSVPQP
jgi:hypothetical protein